MDVEPISCPGSELIDLFENETRNDVARVDPASFAAEGVSDESTRLDSRLTATVNCQL